MQFLDKLVGLVPQEDVEKAKESFSDSMDGLLGIIRTSISTELEKIVEEQKLKIQEELTNKISTLK